MRKNFPIKRISALILLAVFCPFSLVHPFTADVINIDNRDYEAAVTREIDAAKETIDMAIYSLYIKEGGGDFPAYNLLNHLIMAAKRGVDVRVFLDKSPTNNKGNEAAYRLLSQNSIEAYFMKPDNKLHAKLIIIDSSVIIEGSSNWTDNALRKNFENNLLVRSRELARARETFFARLEENRLNDNIIKTDGLRIPLKPLCDSGMFAAIVANSDGAVLDIYLWLLAKNHTGPFDTIDYEEAARYLGIKIDKRSGNYKRDIRIICDKLKDKYHLDIPAQSCNEYLTLSKLFFTAGYDKKLGLKEKVAYLIAVNEQNRIWPRLYWRKSLKTLEETYRIKSDLLSLAFQELKRQNLLEIAPSTASPKNYDNRQPNQYHTKPLTSLAAQARAWSRLERIFGKGNVEQSRRLAEIFDEQNNPKAVQKLCYLLRQYGIDKVEAAVNKIKYYTPTNPLKNIAHVEEILKKNS